MARRIKHSRGYTKNGETIDVELMGSTIILMDEENLSLELMGFQFLHSITSQKHVLGYSK
jgi:hypothetical protein